MATLVSNRLNGPLGEVPNASTLAASGSAGTVSVASAAPAVGGRAEYSGTETVHGLSTIRLDSGHHRGNTPRFTVDLPASGPWWLRWYVWMPRLQDAGLGTNEVRWLAHFPGSSMGFVVHATAAGNVGTRLQSTDLAAAAVNWDVESGTSVPTGEWWVIELSSDGTNFTSRVSNATGSRTRVHTWNNRAFGGSVEITGYRYRRGVLLQPGDNDTRDGTTAVTELQNSLLELGYPLPQWGADGDYGQETTNAVIAFQTDFGYSVVDGIAGPETLAGIDLALREHRGDGYHPALYVSHLEVSDSGSPGLAAPPSSSASGVLGVLGSASGTGTHVPRAIARGALRLLGAVSGRKGGSGSATARLRTAAGSSGTKHARGSATEVLGLSAGSSGTKHGRGSATARLRVFSAVLTSGARAAIVLDYAAGHVVDLEPTEDDAGIANDVTAKRVGGSETSVVREDGPLSVREPPDGVGRYEHSVTLNVAHDVQLRDHAGWRVHLGTHDDARYPTVAVDLAAHPGLIENVASRDSGDWLSIINPPEWLPPDEIPLLIEGYSERLNAYRWEVAFNASSGHPWVVGEIAGDDAGTSLPNRADTAGSELVSAVSESATVLEVRTLEGPRWITTAEQPDAFPFDVRLGGEVCRVTAVDGTGDTQTMTVARGLNGVRRPHSAGTRVTLARSAVTGL